MTAISDAVVIGIVLSLVFAAASYYLYSRVGQLERKVGLMENILLDLKVTTEQTLLSATEPPEAVVENHQHQGLHQHQTAEDVESYREVVAEAVQADTFDTTNEVNVEKVLSGEERELSVDTASRPRTPQGPVQVERINTPARPQHPQVSQNYESMTYKELSAIAKQKGISGTRGMSKAQIIGVLRGTKVETTTSPLSSWTVTNGTLSFDDNLESGMNTLEKSSLQVEELVDHTFVSDENGVTHD